MPKEVKISLSEDNAQKLAFEVDFSGYSAEQFVAQAFAMYIAYSGQRRELACEFPEGANLQYALFIEATDQDSGETSRVGMINSWEA